MDARGSLRVAVAHPVQTLRAGVVWRSQVHVVGTVALAVLSAASAALAPLLLPFTAIPVAAVERNRLRWLTGERIATAHLPADGLRVGPRMLLRLGEAATWRETAHLLVNIVVGAVLIVVIAVEVVFVVSLVGAPWVALNAPVSVGSFVMPDPVSTWPVVVAGLVCVFAFLYINTLIALGSGCVADGLLSAREHELTQKLGALYTSRRVILESFDAERRRIERDLHDGVQQRLVDSSLTLGLLRLELDDSQNRSTELLRRAQRQNSDAMAVLRTTILGISPPVLADHGLVPAIRDLADGASIDVQISVGQNLAVTARFGEACERAAYFIVSEAITNVTKHSGVSEAAVSVDVIDGQLVLSVTDGGRGGAALERGSGLAGLRERAHAIGGELRVRSDPSGTAIMATLPVSNGTSSLATDARSGT